MTERVTPSTATPKVSMRWESLTDQTVQAIAEALRARLEGEVRFEVGDRALYATDASNYRQVPIGVVIPRSKQDVIATIEVCRQYGVPVLSRGGGTSLAGQCCNVAVVMDFSKYMHHVLDVDPDAKIARVQPGTVLDTLRAAAEHHHLTFGPDPATHNHCTLGGMIGNNSCGTHSVMAGRTADNVEALEIVTYDGCHMTVGPTTEEELEAIIAEGGRRGEIYAQLKAFRDKYADLIRTRFPHIPRLVSGYNLPALLPENGFNVARALVGSESTLVTVLEAHLNLVYSPPERVLVALGFPDVYAAGDIIPKILEYGPIACEGIDECLIEDEQQMMLNSPFLDLLPDGHGWLLVEFGGDTQDEARAKAQKLIDGVQGCDPKPTSRLFTDLEKEHHLWKIRESGLGATAWVPGHQITWPGWEDSAVPPDKVGAYLRDFRHVMDRYGYSGSLYGHFGDGCIHISIDFDFKTHEGIEHYKAFIDEMADIVVAYGGSLSGEHGDGQARGQLLVKMFGPEGVEAFREFKAIWDPEGRMNPGKVVDAYAPDQNLRLGTDYEPKQLRTYFQFPHDHFSFADVGLRCAGVGECRRLESGTMCPSYRVTREEKHSTRGRARLLFEMVRGDELTDGWQEEPVKEALDLCLACKGCKGDCPVNVDMATYKSEFLAHYFEKHRRPVTAFSMGLIHWWARAAAWAPGLANAVTHTPGLATVAKAIGGIAQERDIPRFAGHTFREWFAKHPLQNPGGPRVILWADTFNNHFHPDVGKAAVAVLEAVGYQVELSEDGLCCGRPLYDYGFLNQAKQMLGTIVSTMRDDIRDGVPIVGLEPSCVSVFRDELANMYAQDEDALRLHQQVLTLAEFLEKHAPDFEWPKLDRPVVYHGHCHHKAIMKIEADAKLLKKVSDDVNVLDSGCCGMAGAFGFEKEHYDVSQAVGEYELLPKVRSAPDEAIIVTDGFSCHEQITQGTERTPIHLAQLLRLALEQGRLVAPEPKVGRWPAERVLLGVAGAAVLGTAAMWAARRRV